MLEQNSHKQKKPSIEQRTQSIKEEETGGAHTRIARQRRHQGAQARNEFRHYDASHPVSGEQVLRPTHARVRLQRDAAEQAQHAMAAMASQIKPNQIGQYRAERSGA